MAENTVPTAITNNSAGGPPGTTIVIEKRSSLPMMAALVFLTVLGGGGAAWFFAQRDNAGAAGKPAARPGQVVHLEGFTVNLADAEESHFVRVTMDLELERMPEPLEKEKPASGLPVARIRDTIIAVLAANKAEPLLTPEGKIQLKKSLVSALNQKVPEMSVREIYFTEFLVQR
ncbi:MAG TPA: flagellar basal body-associated FliL family protein [Candidatus Acidoferrum sp.]|nr:flagellar basal body-associated FliL family protein [Candidatus Acidoferrum sp.]